ncbi:hypothetical protein TNCV_4016471 [Trichonephila clavipes]|nr:hypothetical protein TNCV_4016471 [Trichonephila clavipes]
MNEKRELQRIGTAHSADRRRIRALYEQLSEFERDRITGLKEAGLQDNTIPHTARVVMSYLAASQTLPWVSQIARYLSNRACLGYDGKATASTREC